MAQKKEDTYFSENARFKKRLLELEFVIKELERAREKEEIKAAHSNKEVQKLRQVLRQKDKEFRSLMVRLDAPTQSLMKTELSSQNAVCSPGHGKMKKIQKKKKAWAEEKGLQGQSRDFNQEAAEELQTAREECAKLKATVSCQEEDLHRAASEIEVLACALEQRAEDLGVDGNLQSGLLYQMGFFQKETHRLELELSKKESEKRDLEKALQDATAKAKRHQKLEEASQQQISDLLEERQVILDYLKETSAKSGVMQDQVSNLLAEKDGALEEYKKALRAENLARMNLERELEEERRLQGRQSRRNSEPGSQSQRVDSRKIGDPVFEKLLKETEAELEVSALATENSQLSSKVDVLQEQVSRLEEVLTTEKSANLKLENRLAELHQAKERAEARLNQHVYDLESTINSLQEKLNQTAKGELEFVATESTSEELDAFELKFERLRNLLKVSNEARDLAEKEATRLEAENAKLRQQLRADGHSTLNSSMN